MPRGIQSAQIVHAAGESSPGNLVEGTFAVVLTVASEKELVDVASRLLRGRVHFVPVFEPDPPYHGALLALGLVPRRKEELKKHLGDLPLLK